MTHAVSACRDCWCKQCCWLGSTCKHSLAHAKLQCVQPGKDMKGRSNCALAAIKSYFIFHSGKIWFGELPLLALPCTLVLSGMFWLSPWTLVCSKRVILLPWWMSLHCSDCCFLSEFPDCPSVVRLCLCACMLKVQKDWQISPCASC